MNKINDFSKNFNNIPSMLPEQLRTPMVAFSKSNNLEIGFVPMIVMGVTSLIISFMYGVQLVLTMFTGVYPCYKSIVAIESKDDSDDAKKTWLAYWCIAALAMVWDSTFGIIFGAVVPFYWLMRIGFYFYLIMP